MGERKQVIGRWMDLGVRYVLLGVLLVGVLWMGGVHYGVGMGLSGVGVLLGLVAWVRAGGRWVGGPIGWALVMWVVVTAGQVVEWPSWLVGWLQPQTVGHYEEARRVLGEGVEGGVRVSLSVNRTAAGLWHGMGMLGVFVAASLQLGSRKRFEWFVVRLLGVGVLFGVAAVVQTVLFEGQGMVLGVMQPQVALGTHWQGVLRTTLVNANHASAVLGVMSLLALGVALGQQDVGKRGLLWAVYGALAVGMCLTLSRGGIVAWVCAHGLVWVMGKGVHGMRRRRSWVVGVVGVMGVVGVAFWLGDRYLTVEVERSVDEWRRVEVQWGEEERRDQVAGGGGEGESAPQRVDLFAEADYAPANASKILIYKDMKRMISDFKWFGIGRGGFMEVYPLYAGARVPKRYSSAENEYLEVAAEYGVGFALVFFGLLGWGLVRVIRRKDWREQDRVLVGGLVMAVAMVAVHNVVDFNVRVPAIGQILCVMLGLLVGREGRYRGVDARRIGRGKGVPAVTTQGEGAEGAEGAGGEDVGGEVAQEVAGARVVWGRVWQRWGQVAVGVVVVVGVVSVGVGVWDRVEDGVEGVDVVALKEVVGVVGEAALMEVAKGVVMDRPVDGYVSFLVGVGLASGGEGAVRERALVWLDRARRLHQFDYRIELARGMVLGGMGRGAEAALAFRAAAELDRGSVKAITLGVVRTFEGVDEVMASLSKSPLDWLQMGEVLLEEGRYGDVIEMAGRLQEAHPERVEGLLLAYRAAVGLGFSEAALGTARGLVEKFGDQPESYVRLYEAQLRQHPPDVAGAYAALLEGLKQHPKSMVLLQYQAHFLLGVGAKLFVDGDQSRWRQVVEEGMDAWRPGALANKRTRPWFYFLRGQYYKEIGNYRQALQAYQAALAALPTHVQSMVGVFEVSLRLGDIEQAGRSLKEIGERLPKGSIEKMRVRLERCREAARKGGVVREVDGKCEEGKNGDAMRQRLTEQRLLRE